jgi:hypothetical protein
MRMVAVRRLCPHSSAAMVTLIRGANTLRVASLFWEAAQVMAKQEGWEPAGAVGIQDRRRHMTYAAGRVVATRDARGLAAALERLVNGERADSGDIDLGAVVELVNFLRGGPFEIR